MAVVTQIQVRRDTAANWTSTNPTLGSGEFGFETDTGYYKIGNGATAWTSLAYAIPSSAVVTLTGTQTLTNKSLTSPLINLGVNTQTGTTYTPVLSDNGQIVTLNNASAISVTIPTNASVAYPIGAQITFAWITGAGQPTISAVTSGTTTILSTGATAASPKLRVVNSTATAVKLATDSWIVIGDIA